MVAQSQRLFHEATMKEEIHLCTELEWPDPAESLRVAIQENPGNVRQYSGDRSVTATLNGLDAPYIAVLFTKSGLREDN